MKPLPRWAYALFIVVLADVGSTFMTWSVSGARSRSSYELVRSAERLLLLEDGAPKVIGFLWLTLPFVAAVIVAALLAGGHGIARAFAAILGVVLAIGAAAIVFAPGPLRYGWGARLGLLLGVLTVLVAAAGPRIEQAWRERASSPEQPARR